jgi:hypothetical protein|nr:MAG TPA: hypothetical protein [Caudoviricetes sp.]
MLDKSFVSPNYCVKHIEASCVYDFSLEHPSSGSVKATEEEIEEIMELFNSIYGMNKLEVIYELYHMKWDSRLLGAYRGINVAYKVMNVLCPLIDKSLTLNTFTGTKNNTNNCDK